MTGSRAYSEQAWSLSRRGFVKVAGITLAGVNRVVSAGEPLNEHSAQFAHYRDRAMGCWLGAAIGDAMGGPVECQHYKRIRKYFGDFKDLLPYRKPPGLISLNPGYALHPEPGCVTDDTFIRLDLARFYLNTAPPYTPQKLADYLLKHAHFEHWWGQAVKVLRRIEKGEVRPEVAGLTHIQGGGGGWWQSVAILHAANPQAASKEAASLCRIWKAPLEQDILSAVVAGQAEAFKKNATIDSVVDAVLKDSGSLAKKLFERAIDIAKHADTADQLYEQLYAKALVKRCTTAVDGPMPDHVAPADYAEGFYSSISFAEQQPWALAYLVFGKGDPRRTVLTAAKGGRDADSIATNTASWLGALRGESVWPKKWRQAVQQANLKEMDLRQTLEDLVKIGLRNKTAAAALHS